MPGLYVTDFKQVEELDYSIIKQLHEEGYTRMHLNVTNYKGLDGVPESHRMPVKKIKYVPGKYFKVVVYDPGFMDPKSNGKFFARKITYNLYETDFDFHYFTIFPHK